MTQSLYKPEEFLLQWGRRNYPAETSGDPRARRQDRVASMGPPELPGGNVHDYDKFVKEREELQWGRRNYPAETPSLVVCDELHELRFNGAAGITRRKLK